MTSGRSVASTLSACSMESTGATAKRSLARMASHRSRLVASSSATRTNGANPSVSLGRRPPRVCRRRSGPWRLLGVEVIPPSSYPNVRYDLKGRLCVRLIHAQHDALRLTAHPDLAVRLTAHPERVEG